MNKKRGKVMEIDRITAKAVQNMRKRAGTRAAAAAARAKWDKENLVRIQCALTNDEAADLDKICRRCGCSRYRVLRALILALIDQEEERPPWGLEPGSIEADLWSLQDHACEIIDTTATLMAALRDEDQ